MKKTTTLLAVFLMLCALLFSSCQAQPQPALLQKPGSTLTPEDGITKPVTQSGDTPDPDSGFRSALTGLPVSEEVSKARYVSVMINNNKRALPHYGISEASLYIEILAEGEINRIMAVFDDYQTLKKLGSVRSARDYFIDYSESLGSVFIHFGGSPQAYATLRNNPIPHLDGIPNDVYSAMFYTDETARKQNGLEHSRFTTGEGILAGLALKNYETENTGKTFFSFQTERTPAGSLPAGFASAPFSAYITPAFSYDETDGLYYRSQFGSPHIDAGNEQQLCATNLLFLYTGHKVLDSEGRRQVDTTGSGKGYYLSGGTASSITWSKASFSEFLTFEQDGKPLSINPGKTWICILPDRAYDTTIIQP